MSATVVRPDGTVAESHTVELPVRWRVLGLYLAVALANLLFLSLRIPQGSETTFSFVHRSDSFKLPTLTVPAFTFGLILALLVLLLAGYAVWRELQRNRVGAWLPVLFGVLVVLTLLTWAGAGRTGTSMQVTSLLVGGLVFAVPLAFGALAGTLCERSGVVNIAIEGQLLAGAFLAALVAGAVAHSSGSNTLGAYAGLLAAPLAGALIGALLALFAVKYFVQQIVVGVVLNVLVVGITSFLFGTLMRNNTHLNRTIGLEVLPVPLLSKIPIIGPIFFNHNILVYLMYVVVIVMHVMLFKSRWGLRVRAVGENPKAADTVGIKVNRTRFRNVVLGGAIAGLGGAYFTVAAGLAFGKEMTSGKGFIALAAMILGRWSPKGALAAALLFGFADSLRQQFGIIGTPIPSQFLAMLPYLATIFAVAGLVGHARPPAASGQPYQK